MKLPKLQMFVVQNNLPVFLRVRKKIVLLATEHRDDVSPTSLYYDVNVQGTKNVLDAMDQNGAKRAFLNVQLQIWFDKKNPNEQHTNDQFNHYGKSKLQSEDINYWLRRFCR